MWVCCAAAARGFPVRLRRKQVRRRLPASCLSATSQHVIAAAVTRTRRIRLVRLFFLLLLTSVRFACLLLASWCAAHFDIPYYEVSAKDATNVKQAFMDLARRTVKKMQAERAKENATSDTHSHTRAHYTHYAHRGDSNTPSFQVRSHRRCTGGSSLACCILSLTSPPSVVLPVSNNNKLASGLNNKPSKPSQSCCS